jgi:hypothetical protein
MKIYEKEKDVYLEFTEDELELIKTKFFEKATDVDNRTPLHVSFGVYRGSLAIKVTSEKRFFSVISQRMLVDRFTKKSLKLFLQPNDLPIITTLNQIHYNLWTLTNC